MGIFTRVRDIISSNLNTMLEKAEDPEKLVKLMIREMEDTLVEIKASCAGAMATKKKIQRNVDEIIARAEAWESKAQLAVSKSRDDLAREALLEKRRYTDRLDALNTEIGSAESLVTDYQADITKLEDKLASAREKQRLLVQRHVRATQKMRTEQNVRRVDTSDAMARFDNFEERIERMESDAELVNYGRKPSLDEEFRRLEDDDELEQELNALKSKNKGE
jgi:phage shock protein A